MNLIVENNRLFESFVNDMRKIIVFEVFSSTRKYKSVNFLFVEVTYEYVMVASLKEIYRANTIVLVLKPQFLIQFIMRGALNGFCYC